MKEIEDKKSQHIHNLCPLRGSLEVLLNKVVLLSKITLDYTNGKSKLCSRKT